MVQIDNLLVELCQMFEIAGYGMTVEDILDRFDRVRKSGRGWVALNMTESAGGDTP